MEPQRSSCRNPGVGRHEYSEGARRCSSLSNRVRAPTDRAQALERGHPRPRPSAHRDRRAVGSDHRTKRPWTWTWP
eukprot:9481436-Pyramimonas_sp.AAC.1